VNNVFLPLYTEIAGELRTAYPGIFVTQEWVDIPAQFPCVSFMEADNYVDRTMMDNTLKENGTYITLTVTVFSNKQNGKRFECIEKISFIDDLLRVKNATRIGRAESYRDSEKKIYMMTARYRLRCSENADGSYTFYT